MKTELGPPPELLFKRKIQTRTALRDLWKRRELIMTLTERELRVRYKQTRLGFAWSIIMPILLVIVFTVFLQRVVDIDTGGAPYAVFVYLGLIPWTFFSVSVNHGGQSLVNNSSLLNKVSFPREVFPIAAVVTSAVDALISTVILIGLLVITGYAPKVQVLWVPVLLIVQVMFTIAIGLMASSLVVYVRDIRQALPLILQLGLFATPVAYPIPFSPTFEKVYAVINPLAPLINGYRRTALFGQSPEWDLIGISALSSFVLLILGYRLFKRLETGFADVA
ncbi:MAG TPA: ABC transporter permease [Actinomycetota bacterium]|nr:ABC transporter permease [Actinomycetota bacterium]